MRRIVVGHNETGKGTVLCDADVEPITVALLPGVELYRMWELEEQPVLPVITVQDGPTGTFFPASGGLRFGFVVIHPEPEEPTTASSSMCLEEAVAEAESMLPGMAAAFEPDRPGMHTTHTVDYIIVVSGEGRMQADDGVEVQLRAGDCLIQNGTPHAGFNDGVWCAVLDETVAGAQLHFDTVVGLHPAFTRYHDDVIDGVGGVHSRPVGLESRRHPRQH